MKENGNIELSQSVHIKEMVKQYGMENCRPVSVPLSPGFQVKCECDCKKDDQTEY